jgi:serine/threonine protein kinase
MVAEMFLKELRKGSRPAVDDYAKAFPHLSDSIRTQLPSVALLEQALHQTDTNVGLPKKLTEECTVQGEIGRGAMGVVYSGYQNELDRRVAIKVIPIHNPNIDSIGMRFELERRAMARLEHPNIVPVYSFGADEHHAYMIMKFIDGFSLDRALHGRMNHKEQVLWDSVRGDWNDFANFASQIASGLQHAHDQGLVHRDVKPANLILDLQAKPWITDFGLAKMQDQYNSVSRTGNVVGTPRYMAPEQLRGVCDARSDIYSLGLTLYELAAGARVWQDRSAESMTVKRNELIVPNLAECEANVPRDLAKIIMKACAFSPDARYQSAKELCLVLDRFAAGKRPGDRRSEGRPSDEVYRQRARRMTHLIAAATCAAVMVPPLALLVRYRYFNEAPLATTSSAIPLQTNSVLPNVNNRVEPNYLERLAGIIQEHGDEQVQDFYKKEVAGASEEFQLADDEKREIASQFDNVLETMKVRDFSGADVRTFLDGYRQTVLPLATKVISYVRIIQRSDLSPQEKANAFVTLRRLAKAIVNKLIPEDDALLLEAVLTQGRPIQVHELMLSSVSPDVLRNWLSAIEYRIQSRNIDVDDAPLMLGPELEKALEYVNERKERGLAQ